MTAAAKPAPDDARAILTRVRRQAMEGVDHIEFPELWSDVEETVETALEYAPPGYGGPRIIERHAMRQVREHALGYHRALRQRRYRPWEDAPLRDLSVLGWIADPNAPFAAFDTDYAIFAAVHAMPTRERDTFLSVREEDTTFAELAEEQGVTQDSVAATVALALARLRAVVREGREPDEARSDKPDPDLVLLARWLARALSAEDETAMEERFVENEAFYLKTAPVMQIWTLPVRFGSEGQLEEFGLVGQLGSRDMCLLTRYLSRELPLKDVVAIQRRLKTDREFATFAQPFIAFWQSPHCREVKQLLRLANPDCQDWYQGAFDPEKWSGEGEEDPDLRLLAAYLSGWLPRRYDQAVVRRFATDHAFHEKVWPLARVWRTRGLVLERVLEPVGTGADGADDEVVIVESTDADQTLVRRYLAMRLPESHAVAVEERLRTDDAFAKKVAPLLWAWRIPWRPVSLDVAREH